MSGKKNSLTISASGKDRIINDYEKQVDGLYDDPSGYVTFGIGHCIAHRKSFLIAGAQSDPTLETKLGTWYADEKKNGKAVPYLPTTLNGTDDLTRIKEKAVDLAREEFATSDYKKKYAKLAEGEKKKAEQKADAAIKKETDMLGKTAKGVFGDDLKPVERTVNATVTGIELTQDEFDALVSFTFNEGPATFIGSPVRKRINEGKYRSGDARQRKAAIRTVEANFKLYNTSKGKVLKGLTQRREKESSQFLEDARSELKTVEEKEKKASAAGRGPAAPVSK
jgi:GH24 family phage-related lysozyme (muramidase)